MGTLKLTEIWIYPVKSLGGIRLSAAQVVEKGFEYDRRWMLLDEAGACMTQRVYSQMALMKMSMEYQASRAVFTVNFKGESISFGDQQQSGQSRLAKVWDDPVTVVEVSEVHNAWFSRQLGLKCSLVFFPEENPRPVDPRYHTDGGHVSLADAYPFLIIGEATLSDLNSRLEIPVPMNRFRPNLVFSGGVAFEEDGWAEFKIGSNRFRGVKLCARCAVPTIDQETAQKNKEPLATLAKYRKQENKVLFGQNVIAIDHGKISEGDQIFP